MYSKYNIKYESDAERPMRRLDRIKAWIFDCHPSDYKKEVL
jgi:hypothetical protein